MTAVAEPKTRRIIDLIPSDLKRGTDGIYRRPIQSGLDEEAYRRIGGGYRVASRVEKVGEEEVEVHEVIALAAGGSVPSTFSIQGGMLEAGKLAPSDRNKILQKSYELFVTDPLGGQIAETTKHFIFGKGTTVYFTDPEADKWVQRFRRRTMFGEVEKCLGAMSVYQGEIFLWLRPIMQDLMAGRRKVEVSGDTRLTCIDPQNIIGVEHDPTDVRNVYFYYFEYYDPDQKKKVTLKIRPYDKYDPVGDSANGSIIHIKFNSDPNDPYGSPDFIRVGEWMENYKEYLRDGVIINKLYRSPCYDITIIDGGTPEVQEAMARYKNWKIGSNPVHNDKEKWQVLEFTGPNSSQSEARRAILLVIAAGVGFAEYMLADGSNSNLASTSSQELPVLKKFEGRQDTFKTAFEMMYQIVLMHAAEYGNLAESFDDFGDYYWQGAVEFPNLVKAEEKDVVVATTAALADGYMSKKTAASRIGLSLDEELRRMEAEQKRTLELEKKRNEMRKSMGLEPVDPNGDPAPPPTDPSLEVGKKKPVAAAA